jgi:hypothetical protein
VLEAEVIMKPLLHPRRLWILALLASSFAAAPSLASETYPAALAAALKMTTVPQCTLCHASNLGGMGTVITKFGRSLIAHGAIGGSNIGALRSALSSELKDPVDSDGDSVPDIDELREGSDPNVVDHQAPPPDTVTEGGNAGTPESGGAGGVPGNESQGEGGVISATRGGSSVATTSGGGPATPEPELAPLPEYPTLATGCSLGVGTAPRGGLSGLFALSLFGLLRSRRARRERSHK